MFARVRTPLANTGECATIFRVHYGGHLNAYQKEKIVRLREKGKNISEIVRLLAEDDFKISRLSVRRF